LNFRGQSLSLTEVELVNDQYRLEIAGEGCKQKPVDKTGAEPRFGDGDDDGERIHVGGDHVLPARIVPRPSAHELRATLQALENDPAVGIEGHLVADGELDLLKRVSADESKLSDSIRVCDLTPSAKDGDHDADGRVVPGRGPGSRRS
jgi:hypothetical protein